MSNNSELKLFISYSHLDEENVDEFVKHLAPLKDNGLIKEWYDRKILAGDDFHGTIDNNLENADIICLFISPNFLNSRACKKEKEQTIELRSKKNISVIPIIVSHCGWLDDKDLKNMLAIPTDGTPISNFEDKSKAWHDVYLKIKDIIKYENKIREFQITDKFKSFLQSTELLTKAHSQKEKVLLDDIFIYPELFKFDELLEYEKKENSKNIQQILYEYSKILIAGEDQSGKTTICKKYFVDLRKNNFIPVYIEEKYSNYQGNIKSKIIKALKEQYHWEIGNDLLKYKKWIIPIVDNFHFVKNKVRYIQELSGFKNQILVVDNIFTLNFKDEELTNSFVHYKIAELNPLLRNDLIIKWGNLTDKLNGNNSPNNRYLNIDKTTEFVNSTLGKILGSGIMPAYPFFILSIITTYEIFEKPLDQEITSQGYCYQALIYLYLKKQGVKNDEIDVYINFLSEIAYYLFDSKKQEISQLEFDEFMIKYKTKFNLPVEEKKLLNDLHNSQIFVLNSLNNYKFYYLYLYYYFVAKYLAEHLENKKEIIDNIINNLHKNEYAYIAIFISHHSNSIYILEELILNAMSLFDKYKPATLTKKELGFFDKQIDILIKEMLPPGNHSPEIERKKRLENKKEIEVNDNNEQNDNDIENNELAKEIRRSVKTVEVMGRIIKNRSGSIEKEKLLTIFEEAMQVYLRLLTSFFDLIKDINEQKFIVKFISSRLKKVIEKKDRKLTSEELERFSRIIFWNTNFEVVYTFIVKTVKSLGSDKLTNIVIEVCNKNNTPVSTLIKHGVLLWNNKNLQIDEIVKELGKDDFSEIGKKIMRAIIVDHASMHNIAYKDRQRIEAKLKIPSKRLLIESTKIDD